MKEIFLVKIKNKEKKLIYTKEKIWIKPEKKRN